MLENIVIGFLVCKIELMKRIVRNPFRTFKYVF